MIHYWFNSIQISIKPRPRTQILQWRVISNTGPSVGGQCESNTHLVSVDGSEVFIHLINGIPLCRQKEGEGEEEVFPG